jgi:hypothetical protein
VGLKNSHSSVAAGAGADSPVKKKIYAISLALLFGALIIQSFWG